MRNVAKGMMPVVAALTLLVLGSATVAMACIAIPAPEIDPATGVAAVALIFAAGVIIRGRHRGQSNEAKGGTMREFAKAVTPVAAAVALLVLGTATVSMAGGPVPSPEIDATSAMAAVALVAGAVVIIRGRRKK